MRKAEEFVSRMGIKVRGDGTNEISIAFPNRSRIVGLPHKEKTSRGFSKVSLMLIDEASRVEDKADEHAQWQTGILLDGVDGRG